ncbi:MAG: hypothetical protein FWF38_07335 [Spirochaetaceae bacterium]|nr:hypothetical protein [Spirochaetaceae bacterium]
MTVTDSYNRHRNPKTAINPASVGHNPLAGQNFLLPKHVPSDFDKRRVMVDPTIPGESRYDDTHGFDKYNPNKPVIRVKNPNDSVSITHELIHHAQHKDNPLLYDLKYKYYDKTRGYEGNPYEIEAFKNEHNSYYLKNRPKKAYRNYK